MHEDRLCVTIRMPTINPKKENKMGKSNVTPPTKSTPTAKSESADGEKKPRAARKDYGYAKGATIALTDGEKTFKGARARWYTDYLRKCNGKTVEHFATLAEKGGEKEQPRGWLRFFVEAEACTLTPPPAEA